MLSLKVINVEQYTKQIDKNECKTDEQPKDTHIKHMKTDEHQRNTDEQPKENNAKRLKNKEDRWKVNNIMNNYEK